MTGQLEGVRPEGGWVIGVLLHDFQLGGAERVAIRLANAWCRLGGKVILFAGGDSGLQRQQVDGAVEVVVADPPIKRGLRDSPVKLGQWVASHAVARRVNVFYLPGNSYFRAIGPLSVVAARGARIYATITNSLWRPDRSLMRNLVFAVLTRRRVRKVAGLISMSPALLQQERKVLGQGLPMTALPNALFETSPEPAAVARRSWHVCAVGRLVPQKNFALLLRSFALLNDLPVTLDIVGDGTQMGELQRLAATLGVADRVTFVGAVANAASFLAAAEVMLLTSDYEGYPAVAVEALAAGCFVVASNCSVGMADIVSTSGLGTIVTGHRPEDFALALREFFAGPTRKEHGKRLERARPMVQSHVASQAALRYLAFMGLAGETCTHI